MRSRSSSGALILLLASAAFAQPAATAANEKPAGIEGVVTNALTGEPILHVHVMADAFAAGQQQQFGAITDAEGKFSIRNMPTASYSLRAERVGFVMPPDVLGRDSRTMLRPGDTKSDLKLKLTPTGAILGRVLDTDGNPVEGANVTASSGPNTGGSRGTSTDEKGQFRLGGLAPGRYRIRAQPATIPFPPEIRTDGSVEIFDVPTFYPNAMDAKSATRLEIRSGADITGADIRLQRAPIVRVSGVVTGIPAGMQPGSAHIEIRGDDSFGSRGVGNVAQDGKFEVWKIEPGKWRLTAASNSRGAALRSAPVEVEIAGTNIDGIELRMMPLFDLAGQVEYDDEAVKPTATPSSPRPVSGGASGPPPQPRRLVLQDVNRGPVPQPVAIAADGSFQFTGVQPGRYRLMVTGQPAAIKSMRLGPTSIDGNNIDLSTGGGAALTLVLTSLMGEISGTVTDDKGPVAGARVAAFAEVGFRSFAVTGADGTYRLSNLAARTYKIAAVEDNDPAVMQGNLEDYEDVLATVDVRLGDKLTKDLKRRARQP